MEIKGNGTVAAVCVNFGLLTIVTLACIGKVVEMRKYCFVGVLLLGLSFGANAHDTLEYEAKMESHTATSDFHPLGACKPAGFALALWRR